jgi:acetoin utilization deacetylase AcuC-like enzyme
VRLFKPKPATAEELRTIHMAEYVDSVLDGTAGYMEFGPWSPEGVASVLASTGGMRDAVKEALRVGRSGSLSSGLHHARRSHGNAYCTFNGLALAALEGLKHVEKVSILDLDAHFGGGTANILGEDDRVALADVSVNRFDMWVPIDENRHFVGFVEKPGEYLDTVRRSFVVLEGSGLLIYNAGMDTHEKAGGLKGITTAMIRQREALVVRWASDRQIPVLFALAGGYQWGGLTLEAVARLHLDTVRAFAERDIM